MRLLSSHRLRGRTIGAAQHAHMASHPNTADVQQRMTDIFEGYLDKKSPDKLLGKAQALLQHHPCNRTRPEQENFTASLFAACAHRDARLAIAAPLARLCHIAQSMAHDQALFDASNAPETFDIAALEAAYRNVFERQRVPEALAFYFARTLDGQNLQDHMSFFTDPAVMAARGRIADLLRHTPEAHPIGIDLVGRSVDNCDLESSPPGPLEGISPVIENKVRALLDATWSPAVSVPGILGLCRGLHEQQLDMLLGFCASEGHQALLQACERFVATLPQVRRPAITWGLDEAFREHAPHDKGRK